ncbi:hypothetical protein TRIATDRAFT_291123 [Trichoderma atroviride IMI 206040]|uniref:Transcription factor domain-containing protein n=1 Tax=Hypocrea atroviridis (strain ATCC 20476 / IMI 206040) TaxID=452589 RepID=G9NP42_HYPAI|nr:uncharacterized protein TRIATDRAFT_291123 [Trichoderma atroviride IMI 206040]EHK47828.1 hypothetical protein TRIATDRAFT_291123 [Trichoderma atroviride IMI 206040]
MLTNECWACKVWIATVVANDCQYEAQLDSFYSEWIRGCQKCLPSELCKYDNMGYPAPPLLTDESSSDEGFAIQVIAPPTTLSWLPIKLAHGERELLDHFIYTAPSTLAIFEPNKSDFLGLLVRLALSDNSPASMAVLHSALALSSFHRNGLKADVYRLKARALRILITSCIPSIEDPLIVQHIAASMILCHLEVSLKMLGMPNSVSVWFCHLSEAKHLIDNASVSSQCFRREFSGILGWVDYHMVMARFSIRHWYMHKESAKRMKDSVNDVSHCSHEILRYLHIMLETIRKPTDVSYHDEEYERSLRCLENTITNIVPLATSDTMSDPSRAWVATIELFKLAALIYLQRASRNFSGKSPQIDGMVDRAHILLDDLGSFNPTFPLLIIGCEARTDEQRMRILKQVERAMKTSSLRSLRELQSILQHIWVQDDLAVDYELDYLNRLDAVITSYQIMPSFV